MKINMQGVNEGITDYGVTMGKTCTVGPIGMEYKTFQIRNYVLRRSARIKLIWVVPIFNRDFNTG